MNFQVPDDDSSSTSQALSYRSTREDSLTENQSPEIQMADSTTDPFAGLSVEDKRELLKLLNEKRNEGINYNPTNIQSYPTPINPPVSINRSALPKWSGNSQDFSFYINRLQARIEREWAPFVDPCSICLDMIDTLPEDKKSRVAAWFEDKSRTNSFDWQVLVEHFRNQFDDKEARQSASEYVTRMEQGYNQLFLDFLKDFEYRIAPCREAYTPLGKSMQLKSSLNTRLRRALVGVRLPPLENYTAWVAGVAEVAADLEGLNDYRPNNAKYTATKLGTPKGVTVHEEHKSNVDEEGDYKMGGNALLAAIERLVLKEDNTVAGLGNGKKRSKKIENFGETKMPGKPRAPWRTKEEFAKLIRKRLCVRCGKSGHVGRFCSMFGPPTRPEPSVGAVCEESSSDEHSGNEEP